MRDAIAWVRAHAAEFGAEPGTLFLAGSSAGANLAVRAVCDGETGIAGLICRYGYYGGLARRGDLPPVLIVHGEKDLWHLIVAAGANNWYAFIHVTSPRTAWLSVPLGLASGALGLWAGPRLQRGYGTLAHSMLAPARRVEPALRAPA